MDVLEQLDLTLKAAPCAAIVVDAEGTIVLANDWVHELFGYAQGDLAGRPVEVLVPAEFRSTHPGLRTAEVVDRARPMGVGRELFGVSRTGERIPVEIGLNPVGIAERFVVAFVLDLRQRNREQERIRTALNAAANAMIMVDAAGTIVLINQQVCDLFGYPQEELIGQPVDLLVPQDQRRGHAAQLAGYTRNPSKRKMASGKELWGRRRNGSVIPLEIGLTPFESDGRRYIMATVIDVSDRKQWERTILRKQDELERANVELAEFAYTASHDLKAPLKTIDGLLQLVELDCAGGDEEAVRENIARAREMSRGLTGLVDKLLDLAESENLVESPEVINQKSIVDDELAAYSALRRDGDIQVTVSIDKDCELVAQPTRLRKVLDNLLSNAMKFRDRRKPLHRVAIEAHNYEGGLAFSIEDNGIGIPRDRRSEVFGMFKRFSNHQCAGDGLGLALVRKNVDRMGGQISFQSSAAGTCFTVRLPEFVERAA